MEAQRVEHVLNEYFRQTGEDVAKQTAPSWFEHVLRQSAYLAEKGEKPDWDQLRWAELTDMRGILTPEEQACQASTETAAFTETAADKKACKRRPSLVAGGKGGKGGRSPKISRTWLASLAAALIMFIGVFSVLQYFHGSDGLPSSFSGAIEVTAQTNAAGAVESFVITAEQSLSEELVQQALIITPATEYQLSLENGGVSAVITPENPLTEEKVYTLSFDPERYLAGLPLRASHTWAFQTESPFAVETVHPQDLSVWVDVSSGVTITFNQEIDDAAAKAASIFPEIPGQWQVQGRRLIFIPQQPLAGETVYEITLDASLSAASGSVLGEEKVYRFQTAPDRQAGEETAVSWQIENDESNFAPDTIPCLQLYAWGEEKNGEIPTAEVTLYAYEQTEQYAAALAQRYGNYFWTSDAGGQKLATAALQTYASFTIAPVQSSEQSSLFQINLAQALPEGSYLAEITWYGQTKQALFTVSPLAVYIAQGETDALLWVHNGEEAATAQIHIYDAKESAKTDDQGTALLSLPDGVNQGRTVYIIDNGQHTLAAAAINMQALFRQYNQGETDSLRFDYWHYLYSDRTLYRPGDTVYLFGVAEAKQNAAEISQVEIRLSGGNLPGDGNSLTWDLPVQDGTYEGEIQLPQLQEGYYTLEAVSGEMVLDSVFFQVANYDLPSYQLQVSCDRQAAMVGESITWTIEAAYFDGTPAAGIALTYSFWDQPEAQIVTDRNGQATVETTIHGDVLGWDSILYPAGMFVRATLPEGGEIYAEGYCDVFLNQVEVEGELTNQGDGYQLTLQGYSVDIANLQPYETDEALKEQVYTSLAQPLKLTATLIHNGYRQETESQYNAYTQQLEEHTVYRSYEETEDQFELTLNDTREISFSGTLAYPQDNYRLEITGEDAAGNPLKRVFYLWRQNEYQIFLLQSQDKEQDHFYRQGETINLQVTDGGGTAMAAEKMDQMLFFASQNQIIDYQTTEENLYQRQFSAADTPNIYISAVAYQNGAYTDVLPYQACQDPEDYRGNIQITPDQPSYQPGDRVTLDLRFTDQNGQPLAGKIAVSVVDESLLSIAENQNDIVSGIVDDYYPFVYEIFALNATKGDAQTFESAEAGGAGDGGSREDFADMAYFAVVDADAQGRASLEFTLPDDVTGWRVTAQGYAEGPVCAYEELTLQASLDFFAEARIADAYRLGDQLDVGLRAAAQETIDGEKVSYRISLPQLDINTTAEGDIGAWTEITLPAFSQSGDYTLEITAQYGNHTDRIIYSFQVVDTLAGHEQRDDYILSEDFVLPQRQSDVLRLYFYPSWRQQVVSGLLDLSQQSGARLEQRLAALVAKRDLAAFFPEQGATGQEDQSAEIALLSQYQRADGGISSFTYSQSDLLVSVLAAAVAPDCFDQQALAAYFQSFTGQAWNQQTALAYWGLAALNQPVLNDLIAHVEQAGGETDALSQIYLALALTDLGDGAAAQPLAEEIFALYSDEDGNLVFAANQSIEDTANLALLAGIYDLPGAQALLEYVEDNHPQDEYYLLQRLLILQAHLSQAGEAAVFCYSLDGEEITVDLTRQGVWGVTLSQQQAAQWQLLSWEGEIGVTVASWEPGYPEDAGSDAWNLQLSRSYNQGAATLAADQPVTVTLNYHIPAQAPAGSYEIVDYLPAGLDFIKQIFNTQNAAGKEFWFCGKQGQVLTFTVYKEAGEELSGQVSYAARVQSGGSFIAEAPYLRHSQAASRCSGQEQTVTIR